MYPAYHISVASYCTEKRNTIMASGYSKELHLHLDMVPEVLKYTTLFVGNNGYWNCLQQRKKIGISMIDLHVVFEGSIYFVSS